MATDPLIKQPKGSYTYCVYPHPWAFDVEKGDMMITWSSGQAEGHVVAVKVRLRTVKDGAEKDNAELGDEIQENAGGALREEELFKKTIRKAETLFSRIC
jgi:hypothetical protein